MEPGPFVLDGDAAPVEVDDLIEFVPTARSITQADAQTQTSTAPALSTRSPSASGGESASRQMDPNSPIGLGASEIGAMPMFPGLGAPEEVGLDESMSSIPWALRPPAVRRQQAWVSVLLDSR